MPYFHRPPYLTVEDAEHDMTDFFAELKLSNDYMLTDAEFMVLYAHQTQRFPVGPIQILTKDFDEKTLNIWFEEEEEEEEAEEEEAEEEEAEVAEEVVAEEEATPEDDQKESVDASANSVEEDQTGLIQSMRLVEDEGEDVTKRSIPRIESDESITSTKSEPICGSTFDYVK
jgi:hypothetical protein